MKILRRIYSIWALIWFVLPLLIFYPIFILLVNKPKKRSIIGYLNRVWAVVFYVGSFLLYRIKGVKKIKKKQTYVYCANHTSFLDIPTFGLFVKGKHVFVGKESLSKIPLLGTIFSKLNITVNRESKISSYKAFVKSKEYIKNNVSVILFPEGTSQSKNPPKLNPFKDGPFKLAIDTNTPIVPVSIIHNWYILPNDGKFLPNWHKTRAIIHDPIETHNLSMEDAETLKNEVFEIIKKDLEKYNPHIIEK